MRGATIRTVDYVLASLFQSTRPMRGATDGANLRLIPAIVSIHAPHAGRDTNPAEQEPHPNSFNPRAPCGARPVTAVNRLDEVVVSIHAPHAGRDGKRGYDFPLLPHIYGCYSPQI